MFLIYELIYRAAALTHAWRRWAVLALSLLLARYLFWRASATLNFSSPAVAGLSLLLLGCELVLLISAFLPLWFSWARQAPEAPTLAASQLLICCCPAAVNRWRWCAQPAGRPSLDYPAHGVAAG